MTSLRFDGRVAIVTGAGRGIGREHALLLAARGASVLVNDFGGAVDGSGEDRTAADGVVDEIIGSGGAAAASHRSVAGEKDAAAIVDEAMDRFGRVDIVVNNAGILIAGPFDELSVSDFRRVLDVHFFGTMLVTKAAWPHMVKAGYGRVVNTVSAGMLGIADNSAYGAAKGAVFGLTRNLALDGARNGIAVNCIAPAAATRMLVDALPAEAVEPMMTAMPPGLVAPAVAFLAHESCTLNGELLAVGGGRVNRWLMRETAGIAIPGLTIEDVAANATEICDISHLQPAGVEEQIAATLAAAQAGETVTAGASAGDR